VFLRKKFPTKSGEEKLREGGVKGKKEIRRGETQNSNKNCKRVAEVSPKKLFTKKKKGQGENPPTQKKGFLKAAETFEGPSGNLR